MFFWKPDTVYVFSIMSYGWGNAIFLLDDESSSKEFSIWKNFATKPKFRYFSVKEKFMKNAEY